MWGQHLKRRGNWWHYYRATPIRYFDVEIKRLICFSLRTCDFSEAKVKAAQISLNLEKHWVEAKALGISLKSQDLATRYLAATKVQEQCGLDPKPSLDFSDEELLERLRILLTGKHSNHEQKAILGLVEEPSLSLADAFDRFWDHIKDEWMQVSHDQQRTKRNIYLKAIRNFEAVVGKIPLYEIERRHSLKFRSWWMDRVKSTGLKPYTGNREINSLRRMISINFDIDAWSKENPFARVRLKQVAEVSRIPFERDQIIALLQPSALGKLHEDFVLLFHLLVNTGMRPVEAIGLELDDIKLIDDIPHVHVRLNSTRGLKTDHSERLLPLLGVSLKAAEKLVANGGWGRRPWKEHVCNHGH